LEANVKKIPYSIDAMNQPFDITTKQPQLFVCRDFKHLRDVLEELRAKWLIKSVGSKASTKRSSANNTATCEYSSGLQVTGVIH